MPPRAIRPEPSCGGVVLLWVGPPVGEQLQGWYPSKTKAHKAVEELKKLGHAL